MSPFKQRRTEHNTVHVMYPCDFWKSDLLIDLESLTQFCHCSLRWHSLLLSDALPITVCWPYSLFYMNYSSGFPPLWNLFHFVKVSLSFRSRVMRGGLFISLCGNEIGNLLSFQSFINLSRSLSTWSTKSRSLSVSFTENIKTDNYCKHSLKHLEENLIASKRHILVYLMLLSIW